MLFSRPHFEYMIIFFGHLSSYCRLFISFRILIMTEKITYHIYVLSECSISWVHSLREFVREYLRLDQLIPDECLLDLLSALDTYTLTFLIYSSLPNLTIHIDLWSFLQDPFLLPFSDLCDWFRWWWKWSLFDCCHLLHFLCYFRRKWKILLPVLVRLREILGKCKSCFPIWFCYIDFVIVRTTSGSWFFLSPWIFRECLFVFFWH